MQYILFFFFHLVQFNKLFTSNTLVIKLIPYTLRFPQMRVQWERVKLFSNYRYISKKKCHENGKYFLSFISENETHILYRLITQSEIFQAFIYGHFDDYGLQIMTTQNSVSQKILILHKKGYFKQKCQASENMFISMHSILGWASFCMNYCINVAWHGGNQPVALLRCNGSPGCFDSSLQVICIVGLVYFIFLLTIPHGLSMGFRSGEFAGQSSTVTP